MKKILLFISLLVCVSISCSLFSSTAIPTVLPVSDFLLDKDPDRKPTNTPFQPIPPTLAPTANATSTVVQPTKKPTPTQGPISPTQTPDDQINILVLGSDFRPSGGFRTDVIMLLTIHPKSQSVSILSFPRDLYVFIPGVGMQRINVAQIYGGFSLTQATFQYNFGIQVNHYILANFSGFQTIIDTIGGIDVNAETGLQDKCDLPQSYNGYCSVDPGVAHMNGATALWYVRSRYSSSDIDRTRRAQEVLIALFNKLLSMDALNRINDLGAEFFNNVETDMSIQEIFTLLSLSPKLALDPSRIRRYSIGYGQVYDYIVPESGAMVLAPIQDAMMGVINQALSD